MRPPAVTPIMTADQTREIDRLRKDLAAVTVDQADRTATLGEVLEAATAEKVIELGAAALEMDPGTARTLVIQWAKRQP